MAPHRIRFLALGDSYTIGEGVSAGERWPVQLASALGERGYEITDPFIIAHTGWTADELLAGIAQTAPQGPFDLVSLQIGVNNQYRGGDIAAYRADFCTLLEGAVTFADGDAGIVFVLSIPDWGVTPFAADRDRALITAEIAQFNAVNRAASERAGVLYIDITPASRRATVDTSLLAADDLHPSGKMYALWVKLLLPAVIKALEQ